MKRDRPTNSVTLCDKRQNCFQATSAENGEKVPVMELYPFPSPPVLLPFHPSFHQCAKQIHVCSEGNMYSVSQKK